MTQRIIVFGSNGFVGKSICKKLKSNVHEVEEISRKDFDFDNEKTEENILNIINQNDKVVLAFAKAPAKDAPVVGADAVPNSKTIFFEGIAQIKVKEMNLKEKQ